MLKHIRIVVIVLVLGFLILGVPTIGSALVSLQFDPINPSGNNGDQINVNFLLTGAGSTPVGAIDFWVNYDPSIVLFNGIVWGTTLGDPAFAEIIIDDLSSAGPIDQIGISAGWDPAVTTGSDSFSLFTMIFDTKGVGTSALSLTDAYGIDANAIVGDEIVHDSFLFSDSDQFINIALADIQPGSITVKSGTQVPEPGTALLLGLGLAALASLKKRNS